MKDLARFKLAGELLVQYLFVAPIVAIMPGSSTSEQYLDAIENGLKQIESSLKLKLLVHAKQKLQHITGADLSEASFLGHWLVDIRRDLYFTFPNLIRGRHGVLAAETFQAAAWLKFAELTNALKVHLDEQLDELLTSALVETEVFLQAGDPELSFDARIGAAEQRFQERIDERRLDVETDVPTTRPAEEIHFLDVLDEMRKHRQEIKDIVGEQRSLLRDTIFWKKVAIVVAVMIFVLSVLGNIVQMIFRG